MTLTPHPHAEMLIAIAEGKQMQGHIAKQTWMDVSPSRALELISSGPWTAAIRIKPEPSTITINGHEFPEPMRVAPEEGAMYWVVNLSADANVAHCYYWDADDKYGQRLNNGLCQATKQGAIDCAKALLSLLKVQS